MRYIGSRIHPYWNFGRQAAQLSLATSNGARNFARFPHCDHASACSSRWPCLGHALSSIIELSQIEHQRILGRRAINCDCPRHSSVVAWDRVLRTRESPRRLEERWLVAWLFFRSWFCTDDKSANLNCYCQEQKDAGVLCMHRSIFVSDYCSRVHPSSIWEPAAAVALLPPTPSPPPPPPPAYLLNGPSFFLCVCVIL